MAVVGCCYFGMGEMEDTGDFPHSKFLQSLGFDCEKAGLKLACDSLPTWSGRSEEEFNTMLRHTHFRCAAQRVLKRTNPQDYSHLLIKGTRRRRIVDPKSCVEGKESFVSFCGKAYEKLRDKRDDTLRFKAPAEEVLEEEYDSLGPASVDRLRCFLMLRALLSPVLESYVVMDRFLYLKQQCLPGWDIRVEPIFSQDASPRNMVLVARKAGAKAAEEDRCAQCTTSESGTTTS
eukprot:NODE_5616_length_926_cov_63.001245_g5393_i0.p1 GENE.NODE_5616_length_926_cov_63.001245_g5393_i0~~NODE_5616_length_926_cov_63.001245_g5393_i0.p1  ORF type:complete len:233 (-),score=30.41 NODE_5616_length_926_cov_63.001245_g5393_i0:52-750(-)